MDETVSNYDDKMTLVQEFYEANAIYRVWFLCGKVQCGIERVNVEGENDFASACMSNSCSRRRAKTSAVRAYKVPNVVEEELEKQLLRQLPDAHSGSVEFLYNEKGERLYFDLNLLSTLPLVAQVQDEKEVWKRDYNPWAEMANAMMNTMPWSSSY